MRKPPTASQKRKLLASSRAAYWVLSQLPLCSPLYSRCLLGALQGKAPLFTVLGYMVNTPAQDFRSVEACSIRAAAVIFAERAARKHYGKSGYCLTCTQVAHSTDGRSAEYSAFISYTLRGQRNETVGHNQSFVVLCSVANQPTKPCPAGSASAGFWFDKGE